MTTITIASSVRRTIHLLSTDAAFGEFTVPFFFEFLEERPSDEELIPHLEATRKWLQEQQVPPWATYILGSVSAFYKVLS